MSGILDMTPWSLRIAVTPDTVKIMNIFYIFELEFEISYKKVNQKKTTKKRLGPLSKGLSNSNSDQYSKLLIKENRA